MERLVVKNFLLLKDVDIEIKKYNFLLGPQASGKSLVAKLLYFFYEIPKMIENGLHEKLYKEDILKVIKDRFRVYYPDSLWKNEVFSIVYSIDDFSITIGNKDKKLKTLDIVICKKHSIVFDSILNIYREIEIENRKKTLEDLVDMKTESHSLSIRSIIFDHLKSNYLVDIYFRRNRSVFIPSSRCVYSLLANKPVTNALTFSSDPFLNSFGITYESLKELYEKIIDSNDLGKELNSRFENILKGKYKYENKTDYLIINDKKVNVKYASSGQQEVLPLLIILGLYATANNNMKSIFDDKNYSNDRYYFIEEPEAHLFPEAQAEIMSLLSLIGFESNMPFFITTHSPYLLSILNNFLYGTKLIDEGKISEEQYINITDGARPIRTSEVNAFTLDNGVSKSLMDEDGIFIDSKVLDSASTLINDMYDKFIEQVLED